MAQCCNKSTSSGTIAFFKVRVSYIIPPLSLSSHKTNVKLTRASHCLLRLIPTTASRKSTNALMILLWRSSLHRCSGQQHRRRMSHGVVDRGARRAAAGSVTHVHLATPSANHRMKTLICSMQISATLIRRVPGHPAVRIIFSPSHTHSPHRSHTAFESLHRSRLISPFTHCPSYYALIFLVYYDFSLNPHIAYLRLLHHILREKFPRNNHYP